MMWFILGLFVGAFLGVLGAALACAAGKQEEIAKDLTRNL